MIALAPAVYWLIPVCKALTPSFNWIAPADNCLTWSEEPTKGAACSFNWVVPSYNCLDPSINWLSASINWSIPSVNSDTEPISPNSLAKSISFVIPTMIEPRSKSLTSASTVTSSLIPNWLFTLSKPAELNVSFKPGIFANANISFVPSLTILPDSHLTFENLPVLIFNIPPAK